ncbi:unnamed protein product [Lathyrus sativus]|nr:unnamed protein product [Lathyrus sativus]
MSGSDRKRSSKWDLSDEPKLSSGSKQIRSGQSSADVAGSNSSKWAYSEGNDKLRPVMGYSSKEYFSGDRCSNEEDAMIKDHRMLDTRREWDIDGSYEERKQKRHSQSPKNAWSSSRSRSRSWSRSPPRGFRRDSGVDDRKRIRVGGSTRPCRDFAVGKCRRGSLCNFLHHDNQNHEDSWEGKHREDGAPKYSATYESGDHSFKSGRSNKACINFAKGSCRIGASCKYVHDNDSDGYGKVYMDEFTREREDGGAPRYFAAHEREDRSFKRGRSNEACTNFAKGRCRMGSSCNFVHDNDSDGYGKVFKDEFTREREIDRRHRDNSFEQSGGHVPSRTSDTPCKFFANGNCRNGKYCRFSHDRQSFKSPNRRLRDDRWARNPGGDYQMDRRKLSDSISPNRRLRDDRWGSDGDMADPDRVRDSPKRNDTISVSDTANLMENKSGNIGATEPGFTALPITDEWGHGLDKSRLLCKPQISNDKKEANRWIAANTGANMHGSQSLGTTDIWPGDAEMSPDWKYRTGSSSHMEEDVQNKHGISQGDTYLAISEQDRTQLAPGQSINQNAQNVNPLHTSSSHAVGQSQVDVRTYPSREGTVDATHSQEVSTEKKYSVESNVMDSGLSQAGSINPPTQNTVSNEQLAQLTDLSASLAHILGSGQQLPQLYAALNSHDLKGSPSQANTQLPAMPVSNTCIKPDSAVGLPKQYDPMNGSNEQKNADASGLPPTIPPSKNIAKVEILSPLSNLGKQNYGDSIKGASSELIKSDNLIRLQPGHNTVLYNNEEVAKERKNSQDVHKSAKENGPQNTDQDGKLDDDKQTKDMKGIRAFKFALAEFVKELLKPAWKEGQINKDNYKTIVKKVVDKVSSTMQGANIPQTPEKIDQYLSFSKPKVNKLVQAYVEKVQVQKG